MKTRSTCISWALLLSSLSALEAQSTYVLGGPTGTLTPGSGSWSWDASVFAPLRAAIENPAHFGPAGTVPVQVKTVDRSDTAALDYHVDGYVVPWWADAEMSAAQRDEIVTAFMGGMDLIVLQDDDLHDPIGEALRVTTTTGTSSPSNGLGQFFDGPFGPASDILPSGNFGQLFFPFVQLEKGKVAALNAQNEVIAAYWNKGEFGPRAGALVMIADVDAITSSATFGPLNNHGTFALNMIAYVVGRESVALVAGPDASLAPGIYGWDGSVLTGFRSALENPAHFGKQGTVPTRIITVSLDDLSEESLQQASVFVMPWWADSVASPHLASIGNYHASGGHVLSMNDDSTHDAYAASLGLATIDGVTQTSTGTRPLYQGPFGTAAAVVHAGNMGYLNLFAIIAGAGYATGNAPQGPSDAVFDEERFGSYSGKLALSTDVNTFSNSLCDFNAMNGNALFTLNTVGYLLIDNTYDIAGPHGLLSPSAGNWSWDGSELADFRWALDQTSFGANGAVEKRVTTSTLGALTPKTIGRADCFISCYWLESETVGLSYLTDAFQRGLDLFLLQDSSSHDAIGAALGVPTWNGSSGATSNGPAPYFDGPFGTPASIAQFGTKGYFDPALAPYAAATNGSGQITAVHFGNDADSRFHRGSFLALGDVDMIGANTATYIFIMNDNAKFALNCVAAIIGDACAQTVSEYGFACAGSGGFFPRLDLLGCAAVNETLFIRTRYGLGGAPQFLYYSLAGRGSSRLLGCDFLVGAPFYFVSFPLGGSGAGNGSKLVSFRVDDSSFAGVQLNLQAFLVDPAGPRGISASNGLEFTIGD